MPQLSTDGIAPTQTSVAEVHQVICRAAAELANMDPRTEALVPHPTRPWYEASSHSSAVPGRGLCIEYYAHLLEGKDREWISAMAEIGREAIRAALAQNSHLLTGLMVGEARHGRNYFDTFPLTRAEANDKASLWGRDNGDQVGML